MQGALIIALQREDAALPGDLALRRAVQAAYQLDHLPGQQEVLAIAENWRRALAVCPMCAAAVQTGRAYCCNLHVNHAMLAPDQIDAMPSQREGQAFESQSAPKGWARIRT